MNTIEYNIICTYASSVPNSIPQLCDGLFDSLYHCRSSDHLFHTVQVFTLNAVPLAPEEATYGGICRNFISRDLLEASDLEDALKVPLGSHFHPLLDTIPKERKQKDLQQTEKDYVTWQQSGLIDFVVVVVVRHKVKMCLLKAVDTLGPYTIEGVAENDHGNLCNGSQT